MKKTLLTLSALCLSTQLMAASNDTESKDNWYDAGNSLIAIEGLGGTFPYKTNVTQSTTTSPGFTPVSSTKDNQTFVGAGVKVGAQGQYYRLFLEGTYMKMSGDFDYAISGGASLDLLAHLNQTFAIFVGLNGGIINLKPTGTFSQLDLTQPYAGLQLGINIDLSDSVDFELGARYSYIGYDENVIDDTVAQTRTVANLQIDSITTAYASLIFKFDTNKF